MIDTRELATDRLVLWFECYEFLALEAELLDDDRTQDWLGLLTLDVTYEMPVRQMRRRGEDSMSATSWHMKEDYPSLRTRVARLDTKSAWAEDPPSRTRRLVTNIRPSDASTEDIAVKSNLLLYRGRGDSTDHELLAAERQDVLRRTEGGLRLARRVVHLTHTVLPVQSLGVFL